MQKLTHSLYSLLNSLSALSLHCRRAQRNSTIWLSILLLLSIVVLAPAFGENSPQAPNHSPQKPLQIEAINAATIEGEETLSIFFNTPQTFTEQEIDSQFKLLYRDRYLDHKGNEIAAEKAMSNAQRKAVTGGQWRLSQDGLRLSYAPIAPGNFIIEADAFPAKAPFNRTEVTIGIPDILVKISGRGPILPLYHGLLPIEFRGVESLDLELFAITQPTELFSHLYFGSDLSSYTLNRLRQHFTPKHAMRFTLPPLNDPSLTTAKKQLAEIPLNEIPALTPGAYLAKISPAETVGHYEDFRFIFISDTGIHLHRYPESALLLLHEMSSGKPIESAEVEVWSRNPNAPQKPIITPVGACVQKGLCEIPFTLKESDIIVVKRPLEGQDSPDISLLPVREVALDLTEYAIEGRPFHPEPIHLSSARTLYRPGESITLNILLRDLYGERPENRKPLQIDLITPKGKVAYSESLDLTTQHLNDKGFAQIILPLPQTADVGTWQIEARYLETLSPDNAPLGARSPRRADPLHSDQHSARFTKAANGQLPITVQTFTPERMELNAHFTAQGMLDTKDQTATQGTHPLLLPSYMQKEPATITLEGRYLFGAESAGNAVAIEGEIHPNTTPFPHHPDWFIGEGKRYNFAALDQLNLSKKVTLDPKGKAEIPLHLPLSEKVMRGEILQPDILETALTLTLFDGATKGAEQRLTALFWPHDAMPVIRPTFTPLKLTPGALSSDTPTSVEIDTPLTFELFSTNNKGEILPGNFKVTLNYRPYGCLWSFSQRDGWECHQRYNYAPQEIVHLHTDAENLRQTFTVELDQWGDYTLILEDLESGYSTIYPFTTDWAPGFQLPQVRPLSLGITPVIEREPSAPRALNQEESTSLSATLHTTIHAPFAGHLTLLLEGDQLLTHKSFWVERGESLHTIELDATLLARPDLYLSGFLMAKGDAEQPPTRAVGVAPVIQKFNDKKLKATLHAPEIIEPESPLPIEIKIENWEHLSEAERSESFATVHLVDRGISQISPIKPLPLFEALYGKNRGKFRYNLEVIDLYNRLFRRNFGKRLSPKFGGDGDLVPQPAELPTLSERPIVAFTSPLLRFNAEGIAQTQLELPNFNGELEIRAELFTPHKVGDAKSKTTVRGAIVSELNLPPSLRFNDKGFAELSLFNNEAETKALEVHITLLNEQGETLLTLLKETLSLKGQSALFRQIPLMIPPESRFTTLFPGRALVRLELIENNRHKSAETALHHPQKRVERRTLSLTLLPENSAIRHATPITLIQNEPWSVPHSTKSSQKLLPEQPLHHILSQRLMITHSPLFELLPYFPLNNMTDFSLGDSQLSTEQILQKLRLFTTPLNQLPAVAEQIDASYLRYEETFQRQNIQRSATPLSFGEWERAYLRELTTELQLRQTAYGGFLSFADDISQDLALNSQLLGLFTHWLKNDVAKVQIPLTTVDALRKYLKRHLEALTATVNDLVQTPSAFSYRSIESLTELAPAIPLLADFGALFTADLLPFEPLISTLPPSSQLAFAQAFLLAGNRPMGEAILHNIPFALELSPATLNREERRAEKGDNREALSSQLLPNMEWPLPQIRALNNAQAPLYSLSEQVQMATLLSQIVEQSLIADLELKAELGATLERLLSTIHTEVSAPGTWLSNRTTLLFLTLLEHHQLAEQLASNFTFEVMRLDDDEVEILELNNGESLELSDIRKITLKHSTLLDQQSLDEQSLKQPPLAAQIITEGYPRKAIAMGEEWMQIEKSLYPLTVTESRKQTLTTAERAMVMLKITPAISGPITLKDFVPEGFRVVDLTELPADRDSFFNEILAQEGQKPLLQSSTKPATTAATTPATKAQAEPMESSSTLYDSYTDYAAAYNALPGEQSLLGDLDASRSHFRAELTAERGRPLLLRYLIEAIRPGVYQLPGTEIEAKHNDSVATKTAPEQIQITILPRQ